MTQTSAGEATLIIGLGNPLRSDDGVGVRLAQMLATHPLPPSVEVVDGGTLGLGIVNVMEGRRRVILVDAADLGKSPGQFARFTLDETHLLDEAHLPSDNDQQLSVHGAGLREALLLAHALEMLPGQVIIFGVQPASLEWDDTLTPQVEKTLPDLLAAVLAESVKDD